MNVDGGLIGRRKKAPKIRTFTERVKDFWFDLASWKQILLSLVAFPIMFVYVILYVILTVPKEIIDKTLEDL